MGLRQRYLSDQEGRLRVRTPLEMFRCLEGLASLSAGGTGLCRQPGGAVPEAVNLVDARFDRPRRRQQPGCSTCLLRGGQSRWPPGRSQCPTGDLARSGRAHPAWQPPPKAPSQTHRLLPGHNSQDEGRKPDLDATPSIVEHTFVVKQIGGRSSRAPTRIRLTEGTVAPRKPPRSISAVNRRILRRGRTCFRRARTA